MAPKEHERPLDYWVADTPAPVTVTHVINIVVGIPIGTAAAFVPCFLMAGIVMEGDPSLFRRAFGAAVGVGCLAIAVASFFRTGKAFARIRGRSTAVKGRADAFFLFGMRIGLALAILLLGVFLAASTLFPY